MSEETEQERIDRLSRETAKALRGDTFEQLKSLFTFNSGERREQAAKRAREAEGVVSEENAKLNRKYSLDEQQVLINNFLSLLDFRKNNKKLPYYEDNGANTSIEVEGNPFSFINTLTVPDGMENFMDIKNHEIAALQPLISFFKVDNSNNKQTEIFFESHTTRTSLNNFLSNKKKRGYGVGIKSFNIDFDGTNPFSIKKSIKANLTIFSNSMEELLEERNYGKGVFKYIELALHTGSDRIEQATTDNLNFRIKVVCGLNGIPAFNKQISPQIKKYSKYAYAIVNLTPVEHDFNIDEQGRVTFKINYYGYVEEFFDISTYNALSTPDIIKKQISRRIEIKSYEESCSYEEVSEYKNSLKETIQQEKQDSLRYIFDILNNEQNINTILLDKQEYLEMLDQKTITPSVITNQVDSGSITFTNSEDTPNQTPSNENLYYFYFGDLIDVILKNMDEVLFQANFKLSEFTNNTNNRYLEKEIFKYAIAEKEFKKLRIILGPVELFDQSGKNFFSSIANIPISLRYFIDYMTNFYMSQEEAVYPLITFIRNFINDIIVKCINSNKGQNTKKEKPIFIFENFIASENIPVSGQSISKYDEFSDLMISNGIKKLDTTTIKTNNKDNKKKKLLNISNKALGNIGDQVENVYNYAIFYAGRTQPLEILDDKDKRKEYYIFDYLSGKNSGPIKSIKLSKTASPGSLKLVRFEQEGWDGESQLKDVYDTEIEMINCMFIYPGTYLYVNPKGFAPSITDERLITKFGVGGFFMVTSVSHSFAAGEAKTSIKAKWVQGLTEEKQRVQNEITPVDTPGQRPLCKISPQGKQ